VAHAEGVVGGVFGEEGGEVGVGRGSVGLDEDVERGGGEEGAEDEEEGRDASSLHPFSGYATGTRLQFQPARDEDYKGGERGKNVILLPSGEGKEQQHKACPNHEQQAAALQ
jgi:hypothetical protein